MNTSKIKTLLLSARYTDKCSCNDDWEDAFLNSDDFDVTPINIVDINDIEKIKKIIHDFQFIVLLHSTNARGLNFIRPYKNMLMDRKAKLLVFLGNEVNIPGLSMKERIDFIKDIEPEFIGTQLPIEAGRWLFEDCIKSEVIDLPHALNPDAFKPLVPQEKRKIDIGTRSYPYWPHYGDIDRYELLNFFLKNAFKPPLKIDISVSSRFNRKGWAKFLNNCKATISNEAGTHYLEKDDKTIKKIEQYIKDKAKAENIRVIYEPENLPIFIFWRMLPKTIKNLIRKQLKTFKIMNRAENCLSSDFGEIYDKFFKNYEKPSFYSKCIASRHFDAIGTKTCQIMFEGRFNDILRKDEHYIALKRDFSNIEDVMNRFRDLTYRKHMVDRTYNYIMDSHTYKHRLKKIALLFQ